MNPPNSTVADLDPAEIRSRFPALALETNGQPRVYFDGPAGSQTPRTVIEAIGDYLANRNANHGGYFATSQKSDAMLAEARAAVADFLGASDPDEVVFGANMTTLTFGLSRALAATWSPGDEILVTSLDHDANVTPWTLAARDAGVVARNVTIDPRNCTLDLDDLRRKLTPKTRLLAVGAASNLVGTVNPLETILPLTKSVGALTFVDAVHFAPHRRLEVTRWGCDFLVCSAYKFFGPHVGLLWGKNELLARTPAYKVRPAPDSSPDRWMTGTQNHEGIAGVLAAIEYLADLGRQVTGAKDQRADVRSRRAALDVAFQAISRHEERLSRHLLAAIRRLPSISIHGIHDVERIHERVATFAFTHRSRKPAEIAKRLAERGIFAWSGNSYALPLTEALRLEPDGVVRVGLLHYNTTDEIDRLVAALAELD